MTVTPKYSAFLKRNSNFDSPQPYCKLRLWSGCGRAMKRRIVVSGRDFTDALDDSTPHLILASAGYFASFVAFMQSDTILLGNLVAGVTTIMIVVRIFDLLRTIWWNSERHEIAEKRRIVEKEKRNYAAVLADNLELQAKLDLLVSERLREERRQFREDSDT